MTGPGGHRADAGRWSALSQSELAHACQLLGRLEELAASQRRAISRIAGTELASLDSDQTAIEADLRALLEQAGAGGAVPASDADRAVVAELSARVRRACQHNVGLLAHARRSVSLLLGVDEDRAGYDRRAQRVTQPIRARRGAL